MLKKRKGFTLLELVIVMAIIAIMSTFTLASNTTNERATVNNVAVKCQTLIEAARNEAIAQRDPRWVALNYAQNQVINGKIVNGGNVTQGTYVFPDTVRFATAGTDLTIYFDAFGKLETYDGRGNLTTITAEYLSFLLTNKTASLVEEVRIYRDSGAVELSWARQADVPFSVTIIGPAGGKLGTAYAYTSIVNGGKAPYTYIWTTSDGTPTVGIANAFTTQWATNGSKTLSLTVTDALSAVATANLTVSITNPLTVVIGGPLQLKLNTAYTYTPIVTGGLAPYTYAWTSVGGNPVLGVSNTYTATWALAGVKTVVLEITDSLGQKEDYSLQVVVYSIPMVAITGTANGKLNTAYTYTPIVTGGLAPYTYAWTGTLTYSRTFTSTDIWTVPAGVTSAQVLVVAGGGAGGGGPQGGGGGGGQLLTTTVAVAAGTDYPITVGNGGAAGTGNGGLGGASAALSLTAAGGGGGIASNSAGGASGGGTGVGAHGGGNQAATGGNGTLNALSGAALYYGGGGGGGGGAISGGSGGLGGGGGGGSSISDGGVGGVGGGSATNPGQVGNNSGNNGGHGGANTGGGGGGGGAGVIVGGAGGDGIVIIRYSIDITSTTFTTQWASPGAKTISLTITDSLGQTGSNILGVNIYSAPTVIISGPAIGKVNTAYTYTSIVSGGMLPYIYTWSNGGNPSTGTASSFTSQWASGGIKTINLTITDSLGQMASNSFNLTIYSLPTVTIAGATDGKLATDYTYTPTITGGLAPYTYAWTGTYYKAFTSSSTWTVPAGVTSVKVVVIGGGGSGGSDVGGGGGAGGYAYNSAFPVSAGNSIPITVGLGGTAVGADNVGNNGQDSVFSTITAKGGGGGSGYGHGVSGASLATAGGSGGGGSTNGLIGANALGTQGNKGGNGLSSGTIIDGGGGGGANAAGVNGIAGNGGAGGAGVANPITGTTLAGGGGGGGYSPYSQAAGAGGSGGGGAGSNVPYGTATSGAQNTGGGGGGSAGGGGADQSGAGGSGIVILQYSTCTASSIITQWLTPGAKTVALTVTDSLGQTGSNTLGVTIYAAPTVAITGPTDGKLATDYTYTPIITGGSAPYAYSWTGTFSRIFASSGSWTVPTGVTSIKVVVVGGGGSGGNNCAGGGGAGGYLYTSAFPVSAGASIPITVGNGGAAVFSSGAGNNGQDSVFSTLIAKGGGGGNGGSGGSGGGAQAGGDAGSALGTQGHDGGASLPPPPYAGSGGGGASTAGGNVIGSSGGVGGGGIANPITGTILAGGGGGGGNSNPAASAGAGGVGGGGAGTAVFNGTATAGTPNTGGGGGGSPGGGNPSQSGAGGSGVVILQYSVNITSTAFTTQWFSNGTKTVALTVTDNLGQTCSNTLDVVIYSVTTLVIAGPPVGKLNTGYTFTATADGGVAPYTFNFEGTGDSSNTNYTKTWNVNSWGVGAWTGHSMVGGLGCTVTDSIGQTGVGTVAGGITIYDAPTVVVTGAANGKLNTGYTFTATVVGGRAPYTYSWGPNNTYVGTWNVNSWGVGAWTGHSMGGGVEVTVTDALGQTCYNSTGITIYDAPTVTISGASQGKLNTGYAFTDTVTGGMGPYSYEWSYNSTNDNPHTSSWSSPGTYNQWTTATDALGQRSNNPYTTITIYGAPTVSISGNTSPAKNTLTTYTANPSGGSGGYTYSWTTGGQASPASGSSQSIGISWSNPTPGYWYGSALYLTMWDSLGQAASASTGISIGP